MAVNIVDMMMGAGKSTAAINMINRSGQDTHFIVITPYLNEVDRYIRSCPLRDFYTPSNARTSKLSSIKKLITEGKDIVSTHALFRRFDREVVSLLKERNYILIMDEVADVIEKYEITKDDVNILMKSGYVSKDPDSSLLLWADGDEPYDGRFNEVRNLCKLHSLALYGDNVILWLFPVEVFDVFREAYVLTYMFSAQCQRYYFDYYGIRYRYLSVSGNGEFCSERTAQKPNYNYRRLIDICSSKKLNRIGDDRFALTRSWYDRNIDTGLLVKLKNNLYNYFRNVAACKSEDVIWTTFSDYRISLKGNGYGKAECFLALNARATNEKADRTVVAYMVNCYLNPLVKQFFTSHGVQVDEDGYALSEMVQFIWRSGIRNGKKISVYIPSCRMRTLLWEWIVENFSDL